VAADRESSGQLVASHWFVVHNGGCSTMRKQTVSSDWLVLSRHGRFVSSTELIKEEVTTNNQVRVDWEKILLLPGWHPVKLTWFPFDGQREFSAEFHPNYRKPNN